jgi:hypothetical protein
VSQRTGDRARKRDPHAGKSIANNTAIRAVRREVARNPDFVTTHIANKQTVVRQNLANQVQRPWDGYCGRVLLLIEVVTGNIVKDPAPDGLIPATF